MGRFSQLKTIHKLIIGFLLSTLLISIIGIIGYVFNSKANKDMSSIYTNHFLSVKWLYKTDSIINESNTNLLKLVNSKDPLVQKNLLSDINKNKYDFKITFENYKDLDNDSFEEAIIPVLDKNLNDYEICIGKIIDLIRTNRNQKPRPLF